MRLVIQIPCFNEAEHLPVTLSCLPRVLAGIDEILWLVVSDGSTDATCDVARAHGVDKVVALPQHVGLARCFMEAIAASLEAGADIIVSLDADNQYNADDIPALIAPILEGRAGMVVGARPIAEIAHFSATKKVLQRLGSMAVRWASKTDLSDAPSGFRAFSREVAMRLNVFGEYTYTLETIIQAGQCNFPLATIPIRTNDAVLRESRLIKSIPTYIWRSIVTILRIFMVYRPLRFFAGLGGSVFLIGLLISLRFLYFLAIGDGHGHVQSLLLAGALMTIGSLVGILGLVADMIAVNRKLLEEVRFRLIKAELAARRCSDKAADAPSPPPPQVR